MNLRSQLVRLGPFVPTSRRCTSLSRRLLSSLTRRCTPIWSTKLLPIGRRRGYAGLPLPTPVDSSLQSRLTKMGKTPSSSQKLPCRRGLPLSEPIPCPLCEQPINTFGDHATCCTTSGDVISRHNTLRNLVDSLATYGLLSPVLEKKGILGPTSGRRPGDVSIPIWSEGKGLAIDVAVTSVLAPSNARIKEPCEHYALSQKHRKYDERFIDSEYEFCAMVFESLGAINVEGEEVLRSIFRFAAKRLGREFSSFCGRGWARVSCTLQRSVSLSILSRIDGHSFRDPLVTTTTKPPSTTTTTTTATTTTTTTTQTTTTPTTTTTTTTSTTSLSTSTTPLSTTLSPLTLTTPTTTTSLSLTTTTSLSTLPLTLTPLTPLTPLSFPTPPSLPLTRSALSGEGAGKGPVSFVVVGGGVAGAAVTVGSTTPLSHAIHPHKHRAQTDSYLHTKNNTTHMVVNTLAPHTIHTTASTSQGSNTAVTVTATRRSRTHARTHAHATRRTTQHTHATRHTAQHSSPTHTRAT